jgi:hypothetical protein
MHATAGAAAMHSVGKRLRDTRMVCTDNKLL